MTTVILAIDTATAAVTAGVAVLGAAGASPAGGGAHDRLEVRAERVTVDARAHAEQLTPNVLAALADAGLGMADLDAVVVGCGPGPFTGLRVGMATAAAFGHALGIGVHGVCSLDAIGVQTRGLTAGDVLVVTDARRREVYWARYRDGIRVEGPAVNAPADVPVGAAVAVAGSPEHAASFDLARLAPARPTVAGLVRVGELGVGHWAATGAPLIPWYLRRPDAQPLADASAVTR
jgi:tRNA threonylcarbamoyl adenosine modification protein YeaZ